MSKRSGNSPLALIASFQLKPVVLQTNVRNVNCYMLVKVLSHAGHGKSKCCIVGNWACFSLLKTFQVSSNSPLQFKLTGGELQAFKLCVLVSLWSR